MELLVLNTLFDTVAVIDVFESFNWTDRYNEAGDFEVIALATTQLISVIKTDYYLYFQKSSHLMIIEDIEGLTDLEDGDRIKITGRSLESILDRRIVLDQTTFAENTSFQTAVLKILNDSLGSNAPEWRVIPNFIISASSNSAITSLKIESGAQYLGDNVYDVIVKLCKLKKVGFKVVLNSSNKFDFSLYIGTDHSSDNQASVPVIFSPFFENITNTKYYKSVKTLKTINYVTGEDLGDGVYKSYGDKFKVTHIENAMRVTVGTGKAWFDNVEYTKESATTVNINAADSQHPRIDTIAININKTNNTGSIVYIPGDPAATPKPKALSNTSSLSQYPIAHITVQNGVTKITSGNIKNCVGTDDCPYGAAKRRVVVTRGGNKYYGLTRREMYTDGSDISSSDDDGKLMSGYPGSYDKLLKQRGREEIAKDENSIAETFDGEVDYQNTFIYGSDYKLGDIVEVDDKYGHETKSRISEVLFSYDEEGFSINPSFTVLDEEEID